MKIEALTALKNYQQADAEGVMVLVSRQALDEAIAELSQPRVGAQSESEHSITWCEEAAKEIDPIAFRPQHMGDELTETDKEMWLRRRNVALYKAGRIAGIGAPPSTASTGDAQEPAQCSHPDAGVWMYRDDDTWLLCPDCGSKWVEASALMSTEGRSHE